MLEIFKSLLNVKDADGAVPVSTTPLPAVVTAVLRPLLAFLIAKLVSPDDAGQLVETVLMVITLTWSAYAAHKAHAKQTELATGTPAKPV